MTRGIRRLIRQVSFQKTAKVFGQTRIGESPGRACDFRGTVADRVWRPKQCRYPPFNDRPQSGSMRAIDWRVEISTLATVPREQISHQTNMRRVVGVRPGRKYLYENLLSGR
jgi:hypothetical protein